MENHPPRLDLGAKFAAGRRQHRPVQIHRCDVRNLMDKGGGVLTGSTACVEQRLGFHRHRVH